MASLSCITGIFTPGNIGSSSGDGVAVPSASTPFPISSLSVFAAAGVATVAFIGLGGTGGLFSESGGATVSFIGSSETNGTLSSVGGATAVFIGSTQSEGTLSAAGTASAAFVGDTLGSTDDTLGFLI